MLYINSKEKLKEFLEYESKKYGRKNCLYPFFAITEKDILWKHNYLLRKTEYYTNTNKKIRKIFFRLGLKKIQNKYCISIPVNVFDKGLKLIHLGTRLVNNNAVVGKDCVLHINTCIVAGGTNKGGYPIIGDNVGLGVGSVVLGNVKLGDNIAVGANAVVNKSFEDGNMTIAGVPAKKISTNTRNDWGR